MTVCKFGFVAASLIPVAVAAQGRAPIPDAAAIKKAESVVKEVFGANIDAAKTLHQKSKLAGTLLEQGLETNDNVAGRYVLLRQAVDHAADGANIGTTSRAIEAFGASFDVNTLTLWTAAMVKLSRSSTASSHQKVVAEKANALIDEAVLADDFEAAKNLGEVALTAARASKDIGLVRDVAARIKEVDKAEGAFVSIRQALKTLETSPTDPSANLAVGKFKCFAKGNWEGGLPMLALGDDELIRALAKQDLAGGTTEIAQVNIGDGWWGLAEQAADGTKEKIQQRAALWYRKAIPGLTGFVKAKVEKKLTLVPPRISQSELTLFDGESLKGWTIRGPSGQGLSRSALRSSWVINSQNRTLSSASRGIGTWIESTESYTDFTLRFEWRFPLDGSTTPNGSGVVIRATGELNKSGLDPCGIEIDIGPKLAGWFIAYDTPLRNELESVDGEKKRILRTATTITLSPVGQWNQGTITCQGDLIRVHFNGKLVSEARGAVVRAGKICIRNQNSDVEFRNVVLQIEDRTE